MLFPVKCIFFPEKLSIYYKKKFTIFSHFPGSKGGMSMKVTSNNWQTDANAAYRALNLKEDSEKSTEASKLPDTDTLDRTAEALAGLKSEKKDSSFRMKSSAPKDSVGQLAAELARAETRLDVQQVMSKAMKALANLKMSAYVGEGEDAKKARQMIKRMEKLIKRIQKKMKHLNKEEQMTNDQKRAEKQQQEQKAKQIREELRSRRRKRRRDEREYAMKELNEDQKQQTGELLSSVMAGLGMDSGSLDLSALAGAGGMDLSAASGDMGSIDITV